jgi:translation initiation factor IF-2
VPIAGDTLYCVENMQRAKTIASDTKRLRMETGRLSSRKVKTLEEMFKRKGVEDLPELNVILKADVDGSLAALRQALGEIPSDEVGLTIRHAAVGAINDSDILLAAACEGIIVAFRVEVSAGARRMAEKHGVDVRPYRVIYDVVDDIRKALSGMLTPEERIESRATAQVRQVFRISKVGAVAGCMVTQGPLERSHLVKASSSAKAPGSLRCDMSRMTFARYDQAWNAVSGLRVLMTFMPETSSRRMRLLRSRDRFDEEDRRLLIHADLWRGLRSVRIAMRQARAGSIDNSGFAGDGPAGFQ